MIAFLANSLFNRLSTLEPGQRDGGQSMIALLANSLFNRHSTRSLAKEMEGRP